MDNKKLINGPVNGIRLVGNINGIEKVVYLFGDYHININEETKCDSFTSKDFVTYFYETMENAKKINKNIKYDFFFENYCDVEMFEKINDNNAIRNKYINTLGIFVEKELDIEKKENNKKNIVINKGSKTFDNLRIHYLDIRSFFGNSNLMYLYNKIYDFIYSFDCNNVNKYYTIEDVLLYMVNMKMHLLMIWISLTHKLFGKEKQININKDFNKYSEYVRNGNLEYMKSLDLNKFEHYAKKIVEKYENGEVKEKILTSHILVYICKKLKKLIKNVEFCEDKIFILMNLLDVPKNNLIKIGKSEAKYGVDDKYIYKLFSKIKAKYFSISETYINILSKITDIYLLRRVLDKKYVSNAVVYTGMAHTQNYIYTLVKYFDFKITHCDYSKVEINKLNNEIKNKKLVDMSELFLKPQFGQCIDGSKFPENFM